MAIKKNAAKADIGPKKQVKATFAECTAKEPLKCKYHGLKTLDKLIGNILASSGYPMPFVTDKHEGEYELRLPGDIDLPLETYDQIVKALHDKGFNIVNKGQLDNGAFQYQIKPSDGSGFESPEGEAELEDADILSSSKAPENNTASKSTVTKKDPFAELENIDTDALIAENELDADLLDNFDELDEVVEEATEDLESELLGNTDFDDDVFAEETEEEQLPKDLTDEQIKDLVSFKGITDEHFEQNPGLMDNYKAIILHGLNPSWTPLNDNQKAWWNDLLDKTKDANEAELPALKVLKATMRKVNGHQEPTRANSTQNHEAEMQKCKAMWNNLIMTAVGGKKLSGTQYWAENIEPIIADYNKALADNDVVHAFDAAYDLKNAVNEAPENGASKPPTKDSLIAEMGNVIAKMKSEGLDLTWDAKKGNALGKAFEDAINAEDIEGATKALDNFKDYVEFLESGGDAPEDDEESITTEDIKDFFKKCGIKKESLLSEENLAATKEALETGKWNGKPLTKGNKKWYEALAKKAPNHKVAQAITEMLNGGNASSGSGAKPKKFSLKAIKDFLQSKKGPPLLDVPQKAKDAKDILEKGQWHGAPLAHVPDSMISSLADMYDTCADGPIKDALLTALGKKEGAATLTQQAESQSQQAASATSGSGAKDALVSALSGSNESMVAEGMLKPLEHDESKFPQNVTQKELDEAIKKGKKLGGHGGLGTRLVEIGGKQYVCKAATGTGASVIRNGYNADMAYRAGGVYAPDAQLYEFGDGKTYKLSEFIPGKRLIDVWQTADEAKRDEIRKELLKGYPLDVLFSNYDVLGTSPEDSITVTIQGADGKPQKTHVAFNNIMIGDDGHAYRVDNDGSFAMTGTGGIKHSSGGGYTTKVEAEKWGNWEDRQWIDDFRTLRRNEKNLGIFDRYSTADIFLSAGNINLDAVVGTLPQGIQKALAKPLFEMKQMTWRAVNMALGGYKNNGFVSMALDASYEASKRGLRELSAKSVSWNDSGFGEYKSHWGNYSPQPFGENPPEKPQDPTTALADKLKNEEYTGSKIGSIIFSAAKTINYHGGEKKFDEKGNPIGNPMSDPDYKPNAAKIAEWEKIDRDKLAELAKTDANAKILLGLYDTIAYSKENGWKKPIGLVPSGLTIQGKLAKDYLSPTEKKIHDDMAGAIAEYKAKMSVYQKELAEYEKRKDTHKKKEEEKAKAAGGSPYHNFHDFAKALMEEGIDTNGIAHRVQTNGIAPIESSMGAQKGSSYADSAVKWKVREMMALGFTPEQILEMAAQKKLYKGNYYTSCINNQLLPHKDEWDRDMASQAMYLGMNMVKMENEHNDLYDKKSGVVFLNRNIGNIPQGLTAEEKKIYSTSSTTGWVGPHVDSAADCMQFEANWWHEPYKQVYAVPLSRIVCCANNDMATGGGYGYGSEQEYVGNLYNLPCWVYHGDQNLTWKGAIDEANKTSGMKGFLKKLASRLGFFSTHPKK